MSQKHAFAIVKHIQKVKLLYCNFNNITSATVRIIDKKEISGMKEEKGEKNANV